MFHPVHALVADFDFYLSYFQTSVAWPAPQLHRQTINLRHTLPNAVAAVTDPGFTSKLREALAKEFRLARTKLHNPLIVDRTLHAKIQRLDRCRIESVTPDELDVLWDVVQSLKINSGKAKLVTNTKALAHVLTELVVPIDRSYTGAFLFRFAAEFDKSGTEKQIFYTAFSAFREIAQKIDLAKYVSPAPDWSTTRPKVIDNAIIGLVEHVRIH